jgi:hypothetical protein
MGNYLLRLEDFLVGWVFRKSFGESGKFGRVYMDTIKSLNSSISVSARFETLLRKPNNL